jgi:predicted RNA-binding protein with PUA-like domain
VKFWLMKSEPSTYSIDKLLAKPKKIDHWEGVRNFQARNFMRDQMKIGDKAFFYHSSCKTPAIVGVVDIVKEQHPDPSAWDPHSPYFDPKSSPEHPRWCMVSVHFLEKFTTPIELTQLKTIPSLKNMILLRPGNRLSITPVTPVEWKTIMALKEKKSL